MRYERLFIEKQNNEVQARKKALENRLAKLQNDIDEVKR
jgi:hypothetical protein